ncbi:MAG TPA: TlpA disulfide reductase family protein [Thermoleophilaceae bacterium]|nr:TlpA disulfide reductase family protein [Thermoleophilaceae bacterium]
MLILSMVVVTGCGSDQGVTGPSIAEQRAALAGAPPPLARVHAQASRLLGGGRAAFRERLHDLVGYPLVVNIWGSWCPPCRSEFPYFQRQALKHGKQIAFLGIDANNDSEGAARDFLKRVPVSYPSYTDPATDISRKEFSAIAFPTTAFIDSHGKVAHLKTGGYPSEKELAADIAQYAR